MKKVLYIIAGCNGAGKTTASMSILPNVLECNEFINADEIARGLSPFNVESVSIEAGRIMLKRIDDMLNSNTSFAIETTLTTKSYTKLIHRAKEKGYEVSLVFFWLNSVELAKERVKQRVSEGGHNIPNNVIERRYFNGIKNLLELFMPIVDNFVIYDNTNITPEMIAEKSNKNSTIEIINILKFNILKSKMI